MRSPHELASLIPLSPKAAHAVAAGRRAVEELLRGPAPEAGGRGLVVLGPCSLHDPEGALAYGRRLVKLAAAVEDRLLLVMRAYVEKSRTALGWRGMADEPLLDGRRDPEAGIALARRTLAELADLGLPLGAELVSPYAWRYWADCLSWAALGARGVEAQALREIAAGLPFPCAFKNRLDGALEPAAAAALVASRPGRVIAPDEDGRIAVLSMPGNPAAILCLRGGRDPGGKPIANLDHIEAARSALLRQGLPALVMADLGHDNGNEADLPRQPDSETIGALSNGRLKGLMLESYLETGCQAPGPLDSLKPGLSVTDPCLGWRETEELILALAKALRRPGG